MIEWLSRVDPERPFLHEGERVWSYGEATEQVERRMAPTPRLSRPLLTATSVFDVLGGMADGGVTVVGPEPETTQAGHADLVVFTSGTSGVPKGVRLTRANLEAAAVASVEHLGHGPGDNWLLAMPLHHVGGLSIVVRQAYTGGSITMLNGFEAKTFAAAIHGGVTMVSAVPTMLRRLIPLGPFSGLEAVLVGGGPIPDGLLEEAVAVGLPVLPTYGMTETFGQVATLRPGSPIERKADPLPAVQIRIERDGRIAVRGPQVSSGYLDEPDRGDPWLVTNDLGEIDGDGSLRVSGRADTVIVTGGENVSPERVEAAIRNFDGVDEVVVVGVPDPEWGQAVVCVFIGSAEPVTLRDSVSSTLPKYMVPKRFLRVDDIPTTAIGKPDRSAVEALFWESLF